MQFSFCFLAPVMFCSCETVFVLKSRGDLISFAETSTELFPLERKCKRLTENVVEHHFQMNRTMRLCFSFWTRTGVEGLKSLACSGVSRV